MEAEIERRGIGERRKRTKGREKVKEDDKRVKESIETCGER